MAERKTTGEARGVDGGVSSRALRAYRRLRGHRRRDRRHALVGAPYNAQAKRDWQFRFLVEAGLQPHHRLLDLGCGTLRGGIPLIDYLERGHYTGVEARAKVLTEARAELAENDLVDKDPGLLCVSLPSELLEPLPPQQYAWAFSVLIHMHDDVVRAWLAFLGQNLSPGGSLYANVLLGDGGDREWSAFPVIERTSDAYALMARDANLAVHDLGEMRDLGHRMGDEGDRMHMLRFERAAG